AMKHGAADFVTKPWSNDRLIAAVEAASKLRAEREAQASAPETSSRPTARVSSSRSSKASSAVTGLVGESPQMQALYQTILKVAPTDANVLILGENGTGKELVAQALHAHSKRAKGPFVPVDLGAVPSSLFESELFGHVKGSFTGAAADREGRFEAASGGTLFLDEIGNTEPTEQAKLLATLQRREVIRVGETKPRAIDVRLVSATNAPVHDRVGDGSFRQDLLYRINTLELRLPPLRDRGDDLFLLADHFLARYAGSYSRDVSGFTDEAKGRMREYHWPGNVRELQHTVERALILADGDTIGAGDLQFSASPSAPAPSVGLGVAGLDLEDIERAAVRTALSKHAGNVTHAAEELGLTRKSLYRRIEKYGL
ncbi:sigma-54-dependent transcriptional regulator, partial [Rubrivirga sp.]|uniref:sigma-54-dependent transcriptional regulator n=1 Tax=Rubrivirga sp. TaxID=1885344 RepID=UPI003C7186A5